MGLNLPTIPGAAIFSQFTSGDINVPGAANIYNEIFFNRVIVAPLGVKQIGPFAFDYEGEESVDLENDITDHVLEDNTSVQDHVGVRPIIISMRGYVSDLALANSVATSISAALTSVENTLSQAPAFLGKYTVGSTQSILKAITQAQSISIQIEQAAARVAQIASFFPSSGNHLNKQQAAFATLSALSQARTVFTAYTPYQVFPNMIIQSLTASQPAWTKTQSDFRVKMKQLRFTNNLSTAAFQRQFGGRAASGFQPQTTSGITSGLTVPLTPVQASFGT